MIAIIILNYNTPYQTIDCIQSVIKETSLIKYKIFIVDNNSTDNSLVILKENIKSLENVELIISNRNEGYSAGNNIVLNIIDPCIFDYCCILNSDTILNNNAIYLMHEVLKDDPSIGAIGPSIADSEGKETQLLRKDINLFYYLFNKRPFLYLTEVCHKLKSEYSYPSNNELYKFNGMVYGCCFLIRTDLFKSVGFFDENVFLYSEEWILGHKLKQYLKHVAYLPTAHITHLHAVSTSRMGKGFQVMHLNLSAFYYLKYYTKTIWIMLFFIYLQNCLIYSLRSLYDETFRKNLKKYLIIHTNLLRKKNKFKIR